MATVKFRLKGELLDTTGTGHEGLRVVVSNTRNGSPDLVLVEETDDTGEFRFVFDRDELRAIFGRSTQRTRSQPSLGGERTLYFSVFDGSNLVHTFTEDVSLRELVRGVNIEETFALPTGGGNRRHYLVKGLVRHPDGTPVDDALVTVNEVRLRSEVELGTDQTNGKGKYRVFYRFGAETNPDGPEVVLSVTATDPDGNVIAGPIRVCDPDARQTVDLVVGNVEFCGPSQYTQLKAEVQPWLDEASLDLGELTVSDVDLIACQSSTSAIALAQLVKSARLADQTGVAEVAFFAFAASGVPSTLTAVLALNANAREQALESAAVAKAVPQWADGEVTAILAAIEAAIPALLVPTVDPTSTLLGAVLDASGFDPATGQGMIAAYNAHVGTAEEFWTQYASDNLDVDTTKLIFGLQAGALTGNFPPLLTHLTGSLASGEITGVRDLAAFSASDWEGILGSGGVGAPTDFPGDGATEQIANYSKMLVRVFEDTYPTAVVSARVKADASLPTEWTGYVDANPDFDLARTGVDAFLIDNPPADTGQTELIRSQLKLTQRLYRVAPRFGRSESILALQTAGLSSSQSIVGRGRSAFLATTADILGGRAEAEEVFERAERVVATTMTIVGTASSSLQLPTMPVLPGRTNIGGSQVDGSGPSRGMGAADLETLFGAQDYCACRHCRSVLGAAAYLTDILKWVCDQPAGNGDLPAYEALEARREDLMQTMLNCQNTNTVMPKIDLVNEVLERYVAEQLPSVPVPDWPQTTWSAEELRAHPEHLIGGVYDALASSALRYPWSLPFSLPISEGRTYLDHLGVRLRDLMDASGAPEGAIAHEWLGFSSEEVSRVVDVDLSDLAGIWGAASFPSDVEGLEDFLDKTGLTIDEVEQLERSRYVGEGGGQAAENFVVTYVRPCELEGAKVTADNLDPALGLIARLVRLKQKLGWTIPELDASIAALSATGTPDIAFLEKLGQVIELNERFPRTSKDELFAWFGDADTFRADEEVRSFYERTFVDEAETEFLWAETTTPGEYGVPGVALSIAKAELLGAMRLDEEAYGIVIDWITQSTATPTVANLSTVSAIYRRASLAAALGLSVEHLNDWQRLTGLDPFDGGTGSVRKLLDFVEAYDRMRAAGMDRDLLEYLFQTDYDGRNALALNDDDLLAFFVDLIRSLQALDVDHSGESDEGRANDEVLEDLLTRIFVDDGISTPIGDLMRLVRDAADDEIEEFSSVYEAFLPPIANPPVDDPITKLRVTAGSGPTPDPLHIADVGERAALILPYLRADFRLLESQAVVTQAFAEFTGVAQGSIKLLLSRLIVPETTSTTMLELFAGNPDPTALGADSGPVIASSVNLDEDAAALSAEDGASFLDGELMVTGQTTSSEFAAARKLHKVAALLASVRFDETWTDWLLGDDTPQSPAPRLTLPVLDDLGPAASVPADAFTRLDNLRSIAAVRDANLIEQDRVPDFLNADEVAALPDPDLDVLEVYAASLSESTGWDDVEVRDLVGALASGIGFGVNSVDDLGVALRLIAIGLRAGVAPARALAWGASPGIDSVQAGEIKAAAKAKHSADAWPEIIEPLRDRLREQQRDALVAYILATNPEEMTQQDDLFARFLIDTQTSACTKTSRIVCAIGTVQSLVQRVLLNLETTNLAALQFSEEAGEEWRWMKRYRVWEANRRIFMYPENWLEPDLRDGKTPLFEALEGALLEGELDDARAEAALTEYLEGLDVVSRLKVVAAYHEEERGLAGTKHVDRYHVVARTSSVPPVYYHRIRIDDAYWTPWEQLPFQIDDERVVATVYRRRLMLFWPQVMTKTKNSTDADPAGEEVHEVRIFSTQLNGAGWASPQLSDEIAVYDFHFAPNEPNPLFGGLPLANAVHVPTDPKRIFLYTQKSYEESELRVRVVAPVDGVTDNVATQDGFHLEFANFVFDAQAKAPRVVDGADLWAIDPTTTNGNDWFIRPNGSTIEGQGFELPASQDLAIFDRPNAGGQISVSGSIIDPLTEFRVVVPRQEQEFIGQRPFVLEDRTRSFFVTSRDKQAGVSDIGRLSTASAAPDVGELSAFSAGAYFQVGDGNAQSWSPLGITNVASTILNESGADLGLGLNLTGSPPTTREYLFYSFHHPYAGDMLGQLRRFGVKGLLAAPEVGEGKALHRQLVNVKVMEGSSDEYDPTNLVARRAVDDIDFRHGGAFSDYNWELFFHAPMLIADQLMSVGRFEEAREWMHYVFDPTNVGEEGVGPQRFWKIKPFFEASDADAITDQLEALSYEGDDPDLLDLKADTIGQIERWRKDPFKPHLIARLRPIAYQRWVVMRYIDLLMAWGDSLFRQDTIETNNEALQLYLLAGQMLGDRPIVLPELEVTDTNFATVKLNLDAFSNFMADVENISMGGDQGLDGSNDFNWSTDLSAQPTSGGITFSNVPIESAPNGFGRTQGPVVPPSRFLGSFLAVPPDLGSSGPEALYFCVPPNSKLLAYWDTVADRLFKLRNCLNIEGVFRQLPLFQPPIDPGLLARAAAAGLDLASALSDLSAPLPHYRFRTMLSVSKDFCGDVRGLGGALLQALTSRDAEGLAQLRAGHEISVMDSMTAILEQRIAEAGEQVDALEITKRSAEERKLFYEERVAGGQLSGEKKQLTRMKASAGLTGTAGALNSIGGALGAVPQLHGTVLPPFATIEFGGAHLAAIFQSIGTAAGAVGGVLSTKASTIGIEAGYERRDEDWTFQGEQAINDIDRAEREIVAAKIREAIAKKELEVHNLRRKNAQEALDYLTDKYTNQELFRWMATEVKRLYFQAYSLAYDVSKRAERCYRYELGVTDASFVQFGYWDNQRKGLLAGDRLMHDLRRMESSYLTANRREYELTKRISLSQLDPLCLEELKATGKATFDLPQWLFDLDHPSHYMRRIKMVDVTIPAVTGAFTNVSTTLTYQSGMIRRSPAATPGLEPDLLGTIEKVATSSGQGDVGLFEPNMNDERYLPFEGKGLVGSSWSLRLPTKFPQFDYRTISDIIVTVRYMAREGGEQLRKDREADLEAAFNPQTPVPPATDVADGQLMQAISLRGAFPEAFNELVTGVGVPGPGSDSSTSFEVSRLHFPYFAEGRDIVLEELVAVAWLDEALEDADTPSDSIESVTPVVTVPPVELAATWTALTIEGETSSRAFKATLGNLDDDAVPGLPTLGPWDLKLNAWNNDAVLKDMLLLVRYRVAPAV